MNGQNGTWSIGMNGEIQSVPAGYAHKVRRKLCRVWQRHCLDEKRSFAKTGSGQASGKCCNNGARFLRLLPQTIFVTGDGATNAVDNYGQLMRKAYNTQTMVDPEVELTLNWLGQKQRPFLDLSLCLSRACLGRMIHFIYNWVLSDHFSVKK
jgi:hypothetical protein